MQVTRWALGLACLSVLAWGAARCARAEEEGVKAPDLAGGVGWIHVKRPIGLADLRGKVVLLDFWTYG